MFRNFETNHELMEEIRNKIKESGLISLDLADFKPVESSIVGFDIADQLWQGLVLKEKDFRNFIATHDWSIYAGKNVYVFCSADAIVPTWAYMLVCSKLAGVAAFSMAGSELDLQKFLIQQKIDAFDLSEYSEGKFIVKGCADIRCPEFAMVALTLKLQTVAKSIMYGEPCSTVPIYKAPKK